MAPLNKAEVARQECLDRIDPYFIFLDPAAKADVLQGRCHMSIYEGVVILRYGETFEERDRRRASSR